MSKLMSTDAKLGEKHKHNQEAGLFSLFGSLSNLQVLPSSSRS